MTDRPNILLITSDQQPYGELYDLNDDPGETRNRWDDLACTELKARLVMQLLFAEMGKEPVPMPRIAGA